MSDEDRELSRTILQGMREIVATAPKKTKLTPPDLFRCQENDEVGAQCLLMNGHQDIHRFRDDTAAVWPEMEEGDGTE